MDQSTRRHRRDASLCLILGCLSVVAGSRIATPYGDAEHQNIGSVAIGNYLTYCAAHEDCVGKVALQDATNSSKCYLGFTSEDNPPRWMEHFWDPYTGEGLSRFPLPGNYRNAYDKAVALWCDELIPKYADGGENGGAKYAEAYEILGRIAHLVMDMGVPAHVNRDPHPQEEYYEKDYIVVPGHRVYDTNIAIADTLFGLMYPLACVSRKFDSNDRDGVVDNGTRRAGGWTPAEGAEIATECYPGAIRAVGGLFKHFYDTVRPTVEPDKPGEGVIHSGLKGVDLRAKAKSYCMDFSSDGHILKVRFEYSEDDDPASAYWDIVAEPHTRNADYQYTHNWVETIDDDRVWIRFVAWDKGHCDSLPVHKWIKMDSTRPRVSNTDP